MIHYTEIEITGTESEVKAECSLRSQRVSRHTLTVTSHISCGHITFIDYTDNGKSCARGGDILVMMKVLRSKNDAGVLSEINIQFLAFLFLRGFGR